MARCAGWRHDPAVAVLNNWLSFITRGPHHAAAAAVSLALLGLFVPLMDHLSAAVVALASLRYGAAQAAMVTGLATVALLAVTWAMGLDFPVPLLLGQASAAVVIVLLHWLPAWLIASTLRVTRSLATALLGAAALGCVVVIFSHLAIDEPAVWWREQLLRGATPGPPEVAEMQTAMINALASVMTGFMGAGLMQGAVIATGIARWWHAILDNPGGFGREFRGLNLGQRSAGLGAVVVALALFVNARTGGLALELAVVVMFTFVFQGIALAHSFAYRRKNKGFLVAFYVSLPFTWVLVATVGLVDTYMDLGKRRTASGT